MKSMPQYAYKRLASDGQVSASPCAIYAVAVYGGAQASIVAFHNATTNDGSTHVFEANTAIAKSHFVDLSKLGGVNFSTACYADLTGTGCIVDVWYG